MSITQQLESGTHEAETRLPIDVELSPSDEHEVQTFWEELYFQISSDTYKKVDAAIAVIELLISSVSVSR
ncbi:hypothetical protein Bca52824_028229 [Brassica carinata]|uniref:Uncharacterized protein n=1 Tax=Brassica carinata TaxID=52824 RepID=A0A8X7VC35_BRACI|nr:hypothetical protein Bca52824_028229 [Brassica carinata]